MSVLIVPDLDEATQTRLKSMADAHGNSLEEEVREILRAAAIVAEPIEKGLGTLIAEMFAGVGMDLEIPEDYDNCEPISFDE